MDRRSFLVGTVGLALAGCNNNASGTLQVRSLKNSIPAQLLSEFSKQKTAIHLKPEDQIQTLFTELQTWQQKSLKDPVPDLVTLGDYWLTTAIRQGLIQPFEPNTWQQWNTVPNAWKAIVTRNNQGFPAQDGRVWGAPYRWGSTVIVYRPDLFQQNNLEPPKDWADLWRKELKGRISLLDQPRETIGLTLKKLGKSYNLKDLSQAPTLESELKQLHQQAKFYSSEHYLQPLLLDDTWAAVGWSTDVLPTLRRNPNLAAVFPASGTALWTDVWVRPAKSGNKQTEIASWVNFLWQPETASQLASMGRMSSPILSTLDPASLPAAVQQNSLLLPNAQLLSKSEFLEPLPEATAEMYRRLWETVRRSA
jgi:putative spermidine/putrescine transport system substrate-binding protein